MSIPAWILDIFAAVMLLVAAVSAGQLVVARAWTRAGARDADIAALPPADGHRHGGDAGGQPEHPAERRLGSDLRRYDGLVRLVPVAGDQRSWHRCPGQRPPRAAPGAQRGDALHVRRARGPGTGRRLRDGRHGGRFAGRDADAARPHARAYLRAAPDRLLGPRRGPEGRCGRVLPRRRPALHARRARTGHRGRGRDGPRCAPAGGGDSAVATMVAPDTAPAEVPPGDPATGQVTASPAERLLLSPAVVKGCRVAMGVTMAFMLLIMI